MNAVMKFIQWSLAILGIVVLGIVAAGFFLPSRFDVSRSIAIEASADKVYDLIADPRLWKGWSVWMRRDPAMDVNYSGPPFGQGAKWAWKSKSEGDGNMEFTRVVPNKRVEYTLYLPALKLASSGTFAIEPVGKGARVTWTNGGDVGSNPLKHYLAWQMDRLVGPDFEAGLANLKALAQKP
jgi:uncharacterized protein YndB with AHSA1/START domain